MTAMRLPSRRPLRLRGARLSLPRTAPLETNTLSGEKASNALAAGVLVSFPNTRGGPASQASVGIFRHYAPCQPGMLPPVPVILNGTIADLIRVDGIVFESWRASAEEGSVQSEISVDKNSSRFGSVIPTEAFAIVVAPL